MQATARIFFQVAKSRRTLDDLCPVKLCVTYRRERKYYSIREKLKNEDWQFIAFDDLEKFTPVNKQTGRAMNPRGEFKDIQGEYDSIVNSAQSIIDKINIFSYGQFEEEYLNKVGTWDNVFAAMICHIQDLKKEERFGYASSFESTLRAITEYWGKKEYGFANKVKVEDRFKEYIKCRKLTFSDITPIWLKNFEAHLKLTKSRSTVGIYLRNLRVLFNLAINEHRVKAKYPFKKHKIKTGKGRKIALSAANIGKIANFKTSDPNESFYRDLFMFSFLGNGVNLSDILRLKQSNIIGDEIEYIRKKTELENDEESKLKFHITPQIRAIIKRCGNKAVGHDAYLFNLLKPEMDEQRIYAEIKQQTKQINKYLRQVARKSGINESVSSYTARHSWATIAKNSGTSMEYISESLGHSSFDVTRKYLDSFEETTRRKTSEDIERKIFNNAI
jgi:integrase/recombinase XerD